MNKRLIQIILTVSVAFAFIFLGRYVEINVFGISKGLEKNETFNSIALFFTVVNLNILLLFVLVFLTFRSGVKLFVAKRSGAFGSSLRTKLVASFLFFSLLPTVVLLYVSTKFMNANFEKWLPENFVSLTEKRANSEAQYQKKILGLLNGAVSLDNPGSKFDFVYETAKPYGFIYAGSDIEKDTIERLLKNQERLIGSKAEWFKLSQDQNVALKKISDTKIIGVVGPPIVFSNFASWLPDLKDVQPGVRILQISFYVMLVVITLLIVFSATWLGFTIARELTTPLQALAYATEQVAHGNYSVKIDDIVSDDEIGMLALSFRSMVSDIKQSRTSAEAATEELKKKANELSEKSEYNEILVRNVNAAVVSIEKSGNIQTWNDEAQALFRVPEQRALGRHISFLIDKKFYEKCILPLIDLIGEGRSRASQDYLGRIGNSDVQLEVTASSIESQLGRSVLVFFISNITEVAKAQRVAAWRDVARRIAHEIKNPLTPIKLGAQRLERRFLDRFSGQEREVFSECIKIILNATNSIQLLVGEFIQFARLPQPIFREANIVEVVQLAVAGLAENSEQVPVDMCVVENDKDIKFLNKKDFPIYMVRLDPDQIGRVVTNLVANAIAASAELREPVHVTVTISRKEKWLRIEVADAGTGVSQEVKEKIFEPYFSTKRTGSGLGLVIVKQIVNEHMGKVRLEDNIPHGSVFTVELPLSEREEIG